MIKLDAKKIGKLIGRSTDYVYQLLRRKGICLQDVDYQKLIDLVFEYRTCASGKYHFTLRDIAEASGKSLDAVRKDKTRKKFNTDDLTSIAEYILYENHRFNLKNNKKKGEQHEQVTN